MKKILAGIFYRLFRGFEIWVLLALIVVAGGYLAFQQISGNDYFEAKFYGEIISFNYKGVEYDITPEIADQYCFKSSGLNAADVYKHNSVPIDQEAYDRISIGLSGSEASSLFLAVAGNYLMPAILMVIFIPVFFGRLFSDGTVRNLVACGFSKKTIYFAALIVTYILDIVTFALSLLVYVLACVCFAWQPPVYIPVLAPALIVSFLVLLTITSISLASLFISKKKTAAFIVGFLILAARVIPVSYFCVGLLWDNAHASQNIDEEYIEILKSKGRNCLEGRIELADFYRVDSYEGHDVLMYTDGYSLPPVVTKTMITVIYSDIYLSEASERYGYGFTTYLMAHDGIMTINMASCAVWTLVSTGLGFFIFNKREN